LKKVEKDFDSERRERKRNFCIAIVSLIFVALSFIFGGNGIRTWFSKSEVSNPEPASLSKEDKAERSEKLNDVFIKDLKD
jgi:predicted permease